MSGTVHLNAPGYLPKLFGMRSSDVSLLSTLSGEIGPDPAAGTSIDPAAGMPIAEPEPAGADGMEQIAARLRSERDVSASAPRKPLQPR
jgi:hypothetical protein